MTNLHDVICIGAGPTGLACAIEAKRVGMSSLVIDKGCLCNSLYHYPTNMNFFTTPERMEIGDIPMTISGGKPTRVEALKYYRRAVEHYGIDLRLYERVERIDGKEGDFVVHAKTDSGHRQYHGKKIVIATGPLFTKSQTISLSRSSFSPVLENFMEIGSPAGTGAKMRSS